MKKDLFINRKLLSLEVRTDDECEGEMADEHGGYQIVLRLEGDQTITIEGCHDITPEIVLIPATIVTQEQVSPDPDAGDAPIIRGHMKTRPFQSYETRERTDGDFDVRELPDGAWQVCPVGFFNGEFCVDPACKDNQGEPRKLTRIHVPLSDEEMAACKIPGAIKKQGTWVDEAGFIVEPGHPQEGALLSHSEGYVPEPAEEAPAHVTPEVLHEVLLLVVEVPPRIEAIKTWTPEQLDAVEAWAVTTHLVASDHFDLEPPPYPSLLGPLRDGAPIPCGNCGKTGHVSGTCPEETPCTP